MQLNFTPALEGSRCPRASLPLKSLVYHCSHQGLPKITKHWTRAGPFEVNKTTCVPMFIHKHIALVEISEIEEERPREKVPTEEGRPDTSHNHQGICLIKAILKTTDSIWLVTKTALVECKDVIYVRVSPRIGGVPWYINWNALIFEKRYLKVEGAITQTQMFCVIQNERADSLQRRSGQFQHNAR